MGDDLKKKNNRTQSSKSSPKSAEEKLKKSMKGLSHMGGTMGGGSLNNYSSSTSSTKKEKAQRKKVGGVVLDLDTIQGANEQKFETKGGRKNVVIIILVLLLVVSLAFLTVSIIQFVNGKKKANLRYFVNGEAEWIIEGKTRTDVVLRQGLARDMMYLINSDLKITTTDSVSLVLEIEVLLEGRPIIIEGLDNVNDNLVRVQDTNRWESKEPIIGGGIIEMFDGLDFSNAPFNLNSNNVKINITAIVTPN